MRKLLLGFLAIISPLFGCTERFEGDNLLDASVYDSIMNVPVGDSLIFIGNFPRFLSFHSLIDSANWWRERIVRPPVSTDWYSSDELAIMGLVGVYEMEK